VSDIVRYSYYHEGFEDTAIAEDIGLLQQNRIRTLIHWNRLSSEQKSKYPDLQVTVLDNACQQVFGGFVTFTERIETTLDFGLLKYTTMWEYREAPFVNRHDSILLGIQSLYNAYYESKPEYALISTSMGMGKTTFLLRSISKFLDGKSQS
jgi:hypothetical protein